MHIGTYICIYAYNILCLDISDWSGCLHGKEWVWGDGPQINDESVGLAIHHKQQTKAYDCMVTGCAPLQNLWKAGANLCACVCICCISSLWILLVTVSSYPVSYIYTKAKTLTRAKGKNSKHQAEENTHITDFLRIRLHLFEFLLTKTGQCQVNITHGFTSVTSAVFSSSSCRSLVVFEELW